MAFNNTTSTLYSANMAFTSIPSTFPTVTLMALAVITIAMCKYFRMLLGYRKKQQKLSPGPKSLPVIGCLHYLVANKPAFRWIHAMMEKVNTDIACIRLGKVHVITVTSSELAQEFLHKQDNIFSSRPVHMSTELPTYGNLTVALTPAGQQWKKMRRIVTSEVLSVQRLRWLQDKRMEEADNLTRYVYNLCNVNENGEGGIVKELMLAAIDNPSSATEWALAEMINEPKILQRAVEELDQVVGRDKMVQESDLPKLNYVKACAREAFRLHQVSPFNVPHVSNPNTTMAGYFISKDSHVLISRLTLDRNPKLWEEPMKFKPERYLNADGSEVVLADPKLGLLSFSTGRRGCPGVVLGSTMTTVLLARLLHGFTWTAPPKVPSCSLVESVHDLALSKPLLALANPRLPKNIFPLST